MPLGRPANLMTVDQMLDEIEAALAQPAPPLDRILYLLHHLLPRLRRILT